MKDWLRRNPLILFLVVLPTCGAILYYGIIASDIYTCESRFLVRSMQQPTAATGLSALLGGMSHDDVYAVQDYILSRDALRELDQKLSIRDAFSRRHVDLFNRFPGPFLRDRSFEEFYRYYGKHVGVELDSSSSISILSVRAYTAQDAYRINSELLEMSERLINTLNDRAREDLIRFSDDEVKLASDKARDASLALLNYRSSHEIFAPDQQAALQLTGVAKLQEDLIDTEADLAQLSKLAPNNPQIAALENRAATLRNAIASEAAKVTSSHSSLSARSPEFERLNLELGFADKQLGIALAERETARSEAQRKQLYLERIVQPSVPDKAMQPRRIRSVLTVFMFGLIAWGIVNLLIASIREHMD